MALNINNGLTILKIFSLFQPIGTSCNSLFNAKDITGIYCDDIGIGSFSMSFHDCKYICIHKAICTAINYDIVHDTCILLPVPCPQGITDQNMKYAIFSDPDQEHCIEWVNYTGSVVHDERWALTRVGVTVVTEFWPGCYTMEHIILAISHQLRTSAMQQTAMRHSKVGMVTPVKYSGSEKAVQQSS